MKNLLNLLLAGALCAGLLPCEAAEKKSAPGPRGGRLLGKSGAQAELVVEKDRNVTIAFYDAGLKPVPLSEQSATVIAESKTGRTTIEFEKKNDLLVSKQKLPAGDGYTVVVQIKPTPEAKPQNYRFVLDMHTCGGCKLAEYACVCGH